MAQSCFVIRTNDAEKDLIWSEIQQGRLRQGWSHPRASLLIDSRRRTRDEWVPEYIQGTREFWDGAAATEDEAVRRYNILSRMLDIGPGDRIVVPKMPNERSFSILEAAGPYAFEAGSEYSHIIPVQYLVTITHDSHEDAIEVQKMLRGYQTAVNRVWRGRFEELVERLVRQPPADQADFAAVIGRFPEPVLAELLGRLRRLRPHQLENLLVRIFKEQGYIVHAIRSYDRQGGDADLIVSMPLPVLSVIDDLDQKVYVQIKQKTGVDSGDRDGVEQLVRRSAGDRNPRLVLLSTADDFTTECRRAAEEHGVSLFAGPQTARAILRFL